MRNAGKFLKVIEIFTTEIGLRMRPEKELSKKHF